MNKIITFYIFVIALIFPGVINCAPKTKARKALDANTVLQQGRDAFFNYNFEEASELYNQYRGLKQKAKQDVGEEFELWELQLETASNAYERVQKIVVIDSISVPKESFYRAYKLPTSAGSIGTPTSLKLNNGISTNEVVYLSEDKDYEIAPVENDEGNLRLYESHKLLDGSWETGEILEGNFEKTGNYAYPFLSGDGQTLYFANNGEDSMGGYDIFVVQKTPISGEYLQPLNLGMPFNSPYDDYMMVIDEENGIGWWATDRWQNENNVTVYVYLIDEVRKNYPSDTENLAGYARIDEFKKTQDPEKEKEYNKILSNLE